MGSGAYKQVDDKLGQPIGDLLGDPEAFIRVYNEFQPRIYSFIAPRVNSVEDAEDLTSKTFEKALRNLGSFDQDKSSMATWLFRIANNLIIDHYRREATRKSVDPQSLLRMYETDEVGTDDIQRLEVLFNIMRDLPQSYQEVITLKFLQGLPNDEVAKILGCSSKTLSMKIYRSLKALKKRLAALEIEIGFEHGI